MADPPTKRRKSWPATETASAASRGKDKGPSDAAHRGFLQARGEIFVWLNSDDTFLPGAVRTAASYLIGPPGCRRRIW